MKGSRAANFDMHWFKVDDWVIRQRGPSIDQARIACQIERCTGVEIKVELCSAALIFRTPNTQKPWG